MNTETITWLRPDQGQLPDADTTVLIHAEGYSEPVWPGFWSGMAWFHIDGMPIKGRVIEWCDMPAGTVAGVAVATTEPACTCLTNQLGPDYCEAHAA